MTPAQARRIRRNHVGRGAKISIQILTHTRCKIVGLETEQLDLLDDALSFAVEGAFFSGKVRKKGGWDGRKHMLNKATATVPRGLLHHVESLLAESGWFYRIEDLRKHVYPSIDVSGLHAEMLAGVRFSGEYAYQLDAVREALIAEHGILWLATGAGKTEIAAAMILVLLNHLPADVNILFVVPNKKLLRDTRERIAKRLGTIVEHIGMVGGGEFRLRRVTVAVINSLAIKNSKSRAKRYAAVRAYLATIGALFLDEGHHTRSTTWYQTAMRCPAQYRYLLSGTPFGSGNGLMVEAVTGPVLARVTNKQLMDSGVSARTSVEMLVIDEPVIDESLGLGWPEVYQQGVINNVYRNARLVEAAQESVAIKLPVLFLVQQKWHGRNVAEMLTAKKISHAFVHGGMTPTMIDAFVDDFKAGEIAVLVSTAELLGEGVDIPEIGHLILADGGKSPRAVLQKVGRSVRRKKGGRENVAKVTDCADRTHRWLADHSLERLDIYTAESFVVTEK